MLNLKLDLTSDLDYIIHFKIKIAIKYRFFMLMKKNCKVFPFFANHRTNKAKGDASMTDTEWMELLQQDSDQAMRGIMER